MNSFVFANHQKVNGKHKFAHACTECHECLMLIKSVKVIPCSNRMSMHIRTQTNTEVH